MSNKYKLGLVIGVLGISLGSVALFRGRTPSVVSSTSSERSQMPDFTNKRILLGYSHNVFVAKVLRNVGEDSYPSSNAPSSEFVVKVIYNIKGNVHSNIIVCQIHGVEPIVKVGATYIFATRYSAVNDWYTFGSQYTFHELSNGPEADDNLLNISSNRVLINELQAAYPGEQTLYIDRRDNTAYNSYKARRYDTSGNLIDDTVVSHQQYLAAHPEATAQYTEPNVSTSAANESAPAVSEQPTATPDLSIAPTATPEESVVPSETPTPTDVTAAPVSTDEPAPTATPSDTPVQS